MAFFVGQKVVCVDDEPGGEHPVGFGLVAGLIYTIREFGGPSHIDGAPTLFVHEIERVWRGRDWPFWCRRFRPVTDISDLKSIVTEVLTGKPRRIEPDKFDGAKRKPEQKPRVKTLIGDLSPEEYRRRFIKHARGRP